MLAQLLHACLPCERMLASYLVHCLPAWIEKFVTLMGSCSGLLTVTKSSLFCLFPSRNAACDAAEKDKAGGSRPGALKSVLEGLEDLWDESQYAEEFSLQSFTNKMVSGK